MTGLNSKMCCVMLTRIGLFILPQFLYIDCPHIVITNGLTHSLKGELAGPEVMIHLQTDRLFWRILLKRAVCQNLSCLLEIFQPSRTR